MINLQFNLVRAYKHVKDYIIQSGFGEEISWQENLRFENIGESDFLRESAWVILSSGMRESVVRKYFKEISFCFLEWESAKKIVEMNKCCYEYALNYFNYPKKINAIIEIAHRIVNTGFINLKNLLRKKPIETLQTLPFIGPITSYHLAKNIGLPVAKADRHLVRLSNSVGYNNVQNFCEYISRKSGDNIPVVDIVLWRFATLRKDYVCLFNSLMK